MDKARISVFENSTLLEGMFFIVLSVVLIVLSLAMFDGDNWMIAPGLFPLVLSCILLLLGVLLIVSGLRDIKALGGKNNTESEKLFNRTTLKLLGIMIFTTIMYAYIMKLVGFYITSFIYLCCMMLFMGEKRLHVLLLVAAGSCGVMYGLFYKLLGLMLPTLF